MLCSEKDEQLRSIDYMSQKLANSGYKSDEIEIAQEKAAKLDRGVILNQSSPTTGQSAEKQLIFTVNRNQILSTKVKEILRNHQEDINKL